MDSGQKVGHPEKTATCGQSLRHLARRWGRKNRPAKIKGELTMRRVEIRDRLKYLTRDLKVKGCHWNWATWGGQTTNNSKKKSATPKKESEKTVWR